MNKIDAIIIDDEPRGISSLHKLLQLNCPEVNVTGTCTDTEDARSKIMSLQPALVFLDIAMPGKTGFDLLQELPEINFEIIFVTAHNNYMIQAFHFSAVDYLLKPVEEDLLIQSVKRAARRMENNKTGKQVETLLYNVQQSSSPQKMKLCIPSLKGFQVIDIADIIYCEASSNYTNFQFANRPVICSSKPIHEYETLLEDCNFVRVHKSHLVNLLHIKEYIRGEGGTLVMSNDSVVEVSRRKKELLLLKMKQYFKF